MNHLLDIAIGLQIFDPDYLLVKLDLIFEAGLHVILDLFEEARGCLQGVCIERVLRCIGAGVGLQD